MVLAGPLVGIAYKDGPPPHMTGGFGEPTCYSCHLDNPLNAEGGSLQLEGVPESYTPRQTCRLIITLSRSGMRRSGFQIAARYASGPQKGQQAGFWRLLNDRVQKTSSPTDLGVEFVEHTAMGSLAGEPGTNSWIVEWTAPPGGGPVQFNVAANASNDDASALGDFIYVKELRSVPSK